MSIRLHVGSRLSPLLLLGLAGLALPAQEAEGIARALSGATIRPLRRSRLGGLIHEYVQVA